MPNRHIFLSGFTDTDGQNWKQSWQAADRLVSAWQKLCQMWGKYIYIYLFFPSHWQNVMFSLSSVNLTGLTAVMRRRREMSASNWCQKHRPSAPHLSHFDCKNNNYAGDTHTAEHRAVVRTAVWNQLAAINVDAVQVCWWSSGVWWSDQRER